MAENLQKYGQDHKISADSGCDLQQQFDLTRSTQLSLLNGGLANLAWGFGAFEENLPSCLTLCVYVFPSFSTKGHYPLAGILGTLIQACPASSDATSSQTFSMSSLSPSSPDPPEASSFKSNSAFSSLINNL